ncbi:hypothetical protein Dcar01_03288 [Deinococcus carri]|uniref:Uncharacterized protein n=1 Tax=Deinococcus carri TaxID=1211323 RepID=A0ABP9WB27_9DEIO
MLTPRHALALGSLLLPAAQGQASQEQTGQQQALALASAYAVYFTAQTYRDYCIQKDPASAGRSRQAFTTWTQRQGLTQFEPQLSRLLGADVLAQFKAQVRDSQGDLMAALQKLGPASQVCGVYAEQLGTSAFDIKARVPNLGALLVGQATTSTGTATGKTSGQTQAAAGVTTVYSVAQLSTLAGQTLAALPKGTSGSAAEEAVLKKLRSLGAQVAVTGTVAPRFNALDQEDDRRTARWGIYCYELTEDDALDPLRGKAATVVGSVSEFDRDTGFTLRNCRVLSAPAAAGLKKSSLPVADVGWRFKNQPAEKFLVAAGKGLQDSQILGVYLYPSTMVGVGGMAYPTYPPLLFLKDGTVYDDPYWAPDSFNVVLSRQLEPQKWGKWTRQGQNFVVKWGDGETQTVKVTRDLTMPPAPAGTKLSGNFRTIGGGGNSALGGDVTVAVSSDYTFTPQGTFKGGRSAGATTSNVTAASQSSTSGKYSVSRYGITLNYADGGQKRLFFYRMSNDVLHIGDSDYVQ